MKTYRRQLPPLTDFIDDQIRSYVGRVINRAADFTIPLIPVDMPGDEIYEALIDNPTMLAAFANAVQYLPATTFREARNVLFEEKTVRLSLYLTPEKYRMFFFPDSKTVVNSESKLGRALYPQIKLAYDWTMLNHTWNQLARRVGSVTALKIAFPWIRPMLGTHEVREANRTRQGAHLLKLIVSNHTPDKVIRMSPQLARICASGDRLMGQYNMLDAAKARADKTPPVIVDWKSMPLMPWLTQHLNEAIEDWTART